MLRVKDVDYQGDYKLALTFSDGVHKIVDLEPYLKGEVFGSLRDKDQFIQYALTPVTIEWANGADLAPEYLYEIGNRYSGIKYQSCVHRQRKKYRNKEREASRI